MAMKPDLELVQIRQDQSFKVWSHGYPFRTVRWHFHPEYELHLVTSTTGTRYVGDHIGPFVVGDLVLVGPNLPHNWISDVGPDETVEERCIVLLFTEEFISGCLAIFPELRFVERLLKSASRGLKFSASLSERAEPLMRALLKSEGAKRISLFIEMLDHLSRDAGQTPLASAKFRLDPSAYMSTAMNGVLDFVGRNVTGELSEANLAKLNGQSVSAFSRAFRKHTGLTFVQYVNAMRIELACQHLTQDDLKITKICYEIGFNNVSNFNRQFLLLKGMPPSKFRTLYREGMRLVAAA
jgi:AraC-like DNA-binding protein